MRVRDVCCSHGRCCPAGFSMLCMWMVGKQRVKVRRCAQGHGKSTRGKRGLLCRDKRLPQKEIEIRIGVFST